MLVSMLGGRVVGEKAKGEEKSWGKGDIYGRRRVERMELRSDCITWQFLEFCIVGVVKVKLKF